jgi:arylsulfatase A-like enzyme
MMGTGLQGCQVENGGGVELTRPNIVLITLDTVRADHLGCYGSSNATPAIDRIGLEGVRFENAISSSPWTLPSHASLMTGLPVSQHGARYDVHGTEGINLHRIRSLGPGPRVLAEVLRDAGYRTLAAIGGVWLQRQFGIGRGFDRYEDRIDSWSGVPAERLTATAVTLLDQRPADTPFFLFLNYFDAHMPYAPPERFNVDRIDPESLPVKKMEEGVNRRGQPLDPQVRSRLESLYDAEIRRIDAQLAQLWDELQERGIYDDTWIIITADHGESFGDHLFFGHGLVAWHDIAHVPLLMKPPRSLAEGIRPGSVKQRWVQPRECFTTLLTRLGIKLPPEVVGRDLLAIAAGESGGADEPAIVVEAFRSYSAIRIYGARFDRDEQALYADGYSYLCRSDGSQALYLIADDPGQVRNLAEQEEGRMAAMGAALTRWAIDARRTTYSGAIAPIDAKNADRLRALGYLD